MNADKKKIEAPAISGGSLEIIEEISHVRGVA